VAQHFKVGQWTVVPDINSLKRDGRTVRLEPKVMQVLLRLAEQPGEVVTKEQLIRRVWAETFVTQDVLTRSISELRKAFEDNAREPSYIQTVAKGGYRILAPVVGEATDKRAERRQRQAWSITLIAVLAITAISIAYYRWQAKVRPETITLAALPIENLSGDPEQEYFSDGLTDEMINQLGRLQPEKLRVIARTSSMRYKGSNKSIAEIGRELHADYIRRRQCAPGRGKGTHQRTAHSGQRSERTVDEELRSRSEPHPGVAGRGGRSYCQRDESETYPVGRGEVGKRGTGDSRSTRGLS
jgi:DNA-binding winged helix-turn-helix (wHTH) protein